MKKLCIVLLTAVNLYFVSNNATNINLEISSRHNIAIVSNDVVPLGEKDPIIFSIEVS
ncbi:hypothetical protein [Clostridium sp.]|uniref:hypothetical protein n=1 Tax=Clostridium sp. TaxID=1506 RepID=UPI002FC63172